MVEEKKPTTAEERRKRLALAFLDVMKAESGRIVLLHVLRDLCGFGKVVDAAGLGAYTVGTRLLTEMSTLDPNLSFRMLTEAHAEEQANA